MNETAEHIVDMAELAIATKGYSAFSFREIAAHLDIKSASVHYHFPTKAHLGLAVAKRYRERYEQALQRIAGEQASPVETLGILINIYRQQISDGERMTVCMMLAAEINQLPSEIQREMRAFYQFNIRWLEVLIQRQYPQLSAGTVSIRACQIFALLQGAMMGAKTQKDVDYFDHAVQAISGLLNQ